MFYAKCFAGMGGSAGLVGVPRVVEVGSLIVRVQDGRSRRVVSCSFECSVVFEGKMGKAFGCGEGKRVM